MTHDPADRREPDLPTVDQVIHDARETSWHDPVTAPGAPTATSAQAPAHASAHAPTAAHAAATSHGGTGTHHEPAGQDSHGADHGEALGPIDTAQWGAGIIGVAVALVVTVCFVLATQGLGAY